MSKQKTITENLPSYEEITLFNPEVIEENTIETKSGEIKTADEYLSGERHNPISNILKIEKQMDRYFKEVQLELQPKDVFAYYNTKLGIWKDLLGYVYAKKTITQKNIISTEATPSVVKKLARRTKDDLIKKRNEFTDLLIKERTKKEEDD